MRLATNNNGWYLYTSKCIDIATTGEKVVAIGLCMSKIAFRSIWTSTNGVQRKPNERNESIFRFLSSSLIPVLPLSKSQFKFCRRKNRNFIFFTSSPAGEYHAKIERISMSSGSMLERQFIHEYVRVLGAECLSTHKIPNSTLTRSIQFIPLFSLSLSLSIKI